MRANPIRSTLSTRMAALPASVFPSAGHLFRAPRTRWRESARTPSRNLFPRRVDMNPHQVDAALFALASPLSKGVLLADEVGLGKSIEASRGADTGDRLADVCRTHTAPSRGCHRVVCKNRRRNGGGAGRSPRVARSIHSSRSTRSRETVRGTRATHRARLGSIHKPTPQIRGHGSSSRSTCLPPYLRSRGFDWPTRSSTLA